MTEITTALLRECFTLDAENGLLIWNERPRHHFKNANAHTFFNRTLAGKPAGHSYLHRGKKLVAIVKVMTKRLLAHRVIFAMFHNIEFADVPPILDHRDLNTENNRPNNLRPATRQQNRWNTPAKPNSKSGAKGVRFVSHSAWMASITANGVVHHLGTFKTKDAAADAYKRAAHQLHGEFARV